MLSFVIWFCLTMESADETRGPKAVYHLVKVMGGRLPIRKHGREDVVWLGARNTRWISLRKGTSIGVSTD